MKNRKYGIITAAFMTAALLSCSVPLHDVKESITTTPHSPQSTSTIVFIHGMFMTPSSWASWSQYFEAQGYKTYAPAWPRHEVSAAQMRQRHPDPALGALTLDDVLASYRKFIDALPEKPILIGHSMGGLITQILLQEGRGVAGIAIDSAPPKGVLSFRWSFLRSNWPVISPFANADEAVLLDSEQFGYAFTNCVPQGQWEAIYSQQATPESRQVGKGSLSDVAVIDFEKKQSPLLFIAGGEDHIIPPSLNYSNFRAYDESSSLTEFKLFPERCHWTVGQDGWKEVADFARTWIRRAVR